MLGARVTISGLQSKPQLNGRQGTVVSEGSVAGRWTVSIGDEVLSIASKNLVKADVLPMGPPLAQSLDELVHILEASPSCSEERSTLPSHSGPAKDCRHGGPPPSSCISFIGALAGSIRTVCAATDGARAQVGRDSGEIRQALVNVELSALFGYWSRPEMSALITIDSSKAAFSCAVDATIDSEFAIARLFVRTGAFVLDWARHGGAQMHADYTSQEGLSDDVVARYAETTRCLWKTRTDRGVTLYLAAHLPCQCLAGAAGAARLVEEHGKCLTCQRQIPLREIKMCARCGVAEYCGPECQRADWKIHKRTCT